MLSKVPFYHSITEKVTIAFGALFSDIFIVHKDKSGKNKKAMKVPLAYSNKDKYIVRLLQGDPETNEDVAVTLPRASFEILSFSYDPARQLNKIHKNIGTVGSRNVLQYVPVPYDLEFSLSTYTKKSDENFQIMEQILPYFTPDLMLSVKIQKDPEIVQDIPVILNSVVVDDQYEGAFEDRRMIITTYSFTVKINYLGELKGIEDDNKNFDDGSSVLPLIKKVFVNLNNNKYSAIVDPLEANPGDVFEIDESWDLTIPRDFDEDLTL